MTAEEFEAKLDELYMIAGDYATDLTKTSLLDKARELQDELLNAYRKAING
jgi:hypothetical protein